MIPVPRIGIFGYGMVGSALARWWEKQYGHDAKPAVYDPVTAPNGLDAVRAAEVVFICVPTPCDAAGALDDSCIHVAVESLAGTAKTIVLKSTVVPGTTRRFSRLYPRHRWFTNPEFLTESTADEDMAHPVRQIIGYVSESDIAFAARLLSWLPLHAESVAVLPAEEVELVKYWSNAWFALKVTFANEFFDLCQRLGADYNRVRGSASADPRIGPSHLDVFHKGYRGFGGKCLPKDLKALIALSRSLGVPMPLLEMADSENKALHLRQGLTPPTGISAPAALDKSPLPAIF